MFLIQPPIGFAPNTTPASPFMTHRMKMMGHESFPVLEFLLMRHRLSLLTLTLLLSATVRADDEKHDPIKPAPSRITNITVYSIYCDW